MDVIDDGPIRISKSLKSDDLCPDFIHDNCDCEPETGLITCTIDHGRVNIDHGPIRISKSLKSDDLCPDFIHDNCDCDPETGLITCTIDHGPIRISKSLKTSEDSEISCQDFLLHNPMDNCECNTETGLIMCHPVRGMDVIDHGPIRISKSLKSESLCPDFTHDNCDCDPETGLITC